MKVARTYTLDHEIVERLVNLNASDLINRLLKEHFEVYSSKNTLLDEKQASFKQLFKKKRNFRKRLELLKSGKTLGLIIIRNFGSRVAKKNQQLMKFLLTLRTGSSHTQSKTSKKVGS